MLNEAVIACFKVKYSSGNRFKNLSKTMKNICQDSCKVSKALSWHSTKGTEEEHKNLIHNIFYISWWSIWDLKRMFQDIFKIF
jgi:hypothetical protein